MLLELIAVGADFLAKNPALVGMVIATEEFVKKAIGNPVWFKQWHKIAIAFALAFLFVIPSYPPKITPELIAQVVAVGGVAAGLFTAGASLAAKVNEVKK